MVFLFVRKNYNVYNGENSKENLMFKNVIAKLTHKNETVNVDFSKETIMLKALCAYRDDIVLFGDDNEKAELDLIGQEIHNIWNRIPVNA